MDCPGPLLNNKFSFNIQFKNSIQINTPTTMAGSMKLLVLTAIIGLMVLSIASPTMADKCCCKNKNGALQLGDCGTLLSLDVCIGGEAKCHNGECVIGLEKIACVGVGK